MFIFNGHSFPLQLLKENFLQKKKRNVVYKTIVKDQNESDIINAT